MLSRCLWRQVIDADSSGTLHITELVQGLLKIRGEIKKSDTVAVLLATKAVQSQVEARLVNATVSSETYVLLEDVRAVSGIAPVEGGVVRDRAMQ